MDIPDRRQGETARESALKQAINPAQRETFRLLERFGWSLRFVRRKLFQEPVAAVYNPETRHLALIEPDGKLVEDPETEFRH